MNASPPTMQLTPAELAQWVTSRPVIDGLTLSGGDPFDQPMELLAEFVERVRSKSSLNILCYTGRTIEALKRGTDPLLERVLGAIDALIDGPYVESLNDGVGWRGSSNQRIHVLGSRGSGWDAGASELRRLEIRVSRNGELGLTGLPRATAGARIRAMLGQFGREECVGEP